MSAPGQVAGDTAASPPAASPPGVADAGARTGTRTAAARASRSAADDGTLWRVAFREGVRAAAAWPRGIVRSPRLAIPTRLLFAPQDLRTSDATIAHDIYGGYFVFAGRAVQTAGRSPFVVDAPSPAWREGLYGFGWLRHLRAADTALARENARALVSEAMRMPGHAHAPESQAVPVVVRRLISFLSQSPLLLTGADHAFYHRFMRSIGLGVRDLERALVTAPRPADRLSAAIGLCYAGLCCEGYESRLRRAIQGLTSELDRQILPDGGHIGRNPGLLIEVLLDLLPLRQVFTSRGVEPPEALERAIDRMLPMLRLFRHGDGSLALFNGMGRAAIDHLATLVTYDLVRGEPARHATYSGYDRIEANGTVLVADMGGVPPLAASADAHAGCLSFELSSGLSRIVVNCGAPAVDGPLRQAARLTAAHSTLVLGEASSARLLGDGDFRSNLGRIGRWLARRLGRVVLAGPHDIHVRRREEADGAVHLSGRHEGYVARFGYAHERRLHLTADGTQLDGHDLLTVERGDAVCPVEAVARFHLHPSVEARLAERGDAILLGIGRSGSAPAEIWRFSLPSAAAVGAPAPGDDPAPTLSLQDSVFFADADGRRPTRQIVVRAGRGPNGRPRDMRWRFTRVT